MFAVIKTGGKQYRVQEGDVLDVEKLNMDKDQKVTLDKVLLIEDEGKTLIGTPFVENALVRAEIIENFKDKKVIIFKKKRRKQYRRTRGHRQELTRIKIEAIVHGEKAVPRKQRVVSEAKAKKAKEERPNKEEKKKGVKKESKVQVKTKMLKMEKSKGKAPSKKKNTAKTAAKAEKPGLKKEK